jgi:hypothetical protein
MTLCDEWTVESTLSAGSDWEPEGREPTWRGA